MGQEIVEFTDIVLDAAIFSNLVLARVNVVEFALLLQVELLHLEKPADFWDSVKLLVQLTIIDIGNKHGNITFLVRLMAWA